MTATDPDAATLGRTAANISWANTEDRAARTANARAAALDSAANRAVDDEVKLARAARIVRAALARRVLTVDDLRPTAGGPDA